MPLFKIILYQSPDFDMLTNSDPKPQNKPSPTATDNTKPGNFDFDAWAIQVRQQMLDALNRRGLK
jgi:hypothetical protein